MKKKLIIIFLAVFLSPLLFYLIYIGSKNQQDPLWNQIDKLVKSKDIFQIKEKPAEIDSLFESMILDSSYLKYDGYKLVSDPFPLTMEYRKFINTVDFVHRNKRIIVLGVTGSGRTTLIDRVSKFIAIKQENILTLSCVPQLEVEYHKQFIGYVDNGKFYKGDLIKFLEKAKSDPLHNYVMLIDDIDMIYPSTFFGAAIWNELENASYENIVPGYGKEVEIPDNFYLISTTKVGGGSVIKLNDEHFRRLSPNGVLQIYPDSLEFLMYLRETFVDSTPEFQYKHFQKLIYTFIKINHYIEENWGIGSVLGQWSTIRKSVKPNEYDEFINKFKNHIYAMNPGATIDEKEIKKIIYSANHDGIVPNSNFFALTYMFFYDSGIFSEASVAISFLAVSTIFGASLYLKRKKMIRKYMLKVYSICDDFSSNSIEYNNAIAQIQSIKQEVDNLALNKKINFTESLFIYNLIQDRITLITKTEETEAVYNKMFDTFMEDDVISEAEYKKLVSFAEKSRGKISETNYNRLIERISKLKP